MGEPKRRKRYLGGGGVLVPPSRPVPGVADAWLGLSPAAWHDRLLTLAAFVRHRPTILTTLRDEVLNTYAALPPQDRPTTLAGLLALTDDTAAADLDTILTLKDQADPVKLAALEASAREAIAANDAHSALMRWASTWGLDVARAPEWVLDAALATLKTWTETPRPDFSRWVPPAITYVVPAGLTAAPSDGFGVPFDPSVDTVKGFRERWGTYSQPVEDHVAKRQAAAERAGWVQPPEERPLIDPSEFAWHKHDARARFALYILDGWSKRRIADHYGVDRANVIKGIQNIAARLDWRLPENTGLSTP
ncbi:MAG: hypothetical protein KC442_13410 [Thermomicrobiales bacterium]|nr:hypothetical protein [Thermomicrobiales bacterium]